MFKKIVIPTLIICSILPFSCTEIEEVNIKDNFVVEAFLFAEEAVTNIRLKTTFPISAAEDDSDPINEASVQLIKNNTTYDLVATGTDGFYHYPDTDLNIFSGDLFSLKVNYKSRSASAQTIVPVSPTGVNINVDSVVIPRVNLSPASLELLREVLQGLFINVAWENPTEDWYYIVVENIEQIKDPIFPAVVEEALEFFRFVSDPTQNDAELIIGAGLRHYGTHQVTVYRVNQEYADLFENSTQDSRDLNEPPSNIENALGIFTAFASERIFFEVLEE